MAEVGTPIGIMAFVLIVSIIFVYQLAIRRKKEYKHGKRKFFALSDNLSQLRVHVSSEADHWPIYARPVMFTEIDHNAQVEFAKAQMALTDADKILPQIATIVEPETPEQFRVKYLFNVPTNLRTIQAGSLITGGVSKLERNILDIKSSIKTLQTDRHQVEVKRLEVERAIQKLRDRTAQINIKLKPLEVWNTVEAHKFSWVVNIADSCQTEAFAWITKSSESEQGYLEHAIADVFISIGNFSLDCIDLFLESQSVNRKYELDVFTNHFRESTDFLQSILSMGEDWNGWRKLQRAKDHIDKFPETRFLAERSLRIFKVQQQNLERLIELVKEINVSMEIEKVDELEKECTFYWFSYEERKTHWEKALGKPPKFPSVELSRFQTQLVGDVLPRIEIDIKQSQITSLIRRTSQTLEWHEYINSLIAELFRELRLHKDAQKAVDKLISSQGKATIMLADLKHTLSDTSPDCSDKGVKLVSDHQAYAERARRVRGADFPSLKNDIELFVFNSEKVLDQHNLQLTKLMSEYNEYNEKISALLKEINLFIKHTPHFDNSTLKVFSGNYKAGWNMLQEQAKEKYSWLRPMTNKMRTWLKSADPFMAQAREKYQAFNTVKNQVRDHLQKAEEEIQNKKRWAERKWGWLRNEITPLITRVEHSLLTQKHEWERLEERKWAELTIHKAIVWCEHFIKATEGLLNDLNQQIGKLQQRQKTLNDKSGDIERVAQNNYRKLSQEDRDEIKSLSRLAMRAETYEMADSILELAQILAMKRASVQDRKEIQKIFNIYSNGGPVFLDKVSNTGTIRGRVDSR